MIFIGVLYRVIAVFIAAASLASCRPSRPDSMPLLVIEQNAITDPGLRILTHEELGGANNTLNEKGFPALERAMSVYVDTEGNIVALFSIKNEFHCVNLRPSGTGGSYALQVIRAWKKTDLQYAKLKPSVE